MLIDYSCNSTATATHTAHFDAWQEVVELPVKPESLTPSPYWPPKSDEPRDEGSALVLA